jgi:serine/threonine protein kinase/formylglycine-generating enzyme required for sulfatase activity
MSEINRYRKLEKLGEGGFGTVWLAEDLDLCRPVALKEPHARLLQSSSAVETYLREARVLASLRHPHIVPVYDAGRTETGSCYVVSKFIDGQDLLTFVQQRKLSIDEIAQLIAKVADALQHTHDRGIVHRDIKPENILLDGRDQPYVTDFGLALSHEEVGRESRLAGTPAYMSPEQAQGEFQRIDCRSDIFSLGIVLYELLTGTKPFRGLTWEDVLGEIRAVEVRPLRQRNPSIPPELERICLKALAKNLTDRYARAGDLAADLRNWTHVSDEANCFVVPTIIPKGLRSYDSDDRRFFLRLLPGPYDQNGLPESLRFWKTRIEDASSTESFSVGVVYGPSGCGKSSLIKAGLLPRLADRVVPAFVEATGEETEQQLLRAIRRVSVDLPRELPLLETLKLIRRGQGIPRQRKLLIVIDQFEQWLHANLGKPDSSLALALRQCDGERVQALLLVRDDFWMPITRFMQELEIPLVENRNTQSVDCFDLLHARQVLFEFGKAYGHLPNDERDLTPQQITFIDQAIRGLADEEQVISIRLALFADMMKGRNWDPATLAELHDQGGVGVLWLEETFSGRSASPSNRYHRDAAQAALRALLPDPSTNLKGHRRGDDELRAASGYLEDAAEYDELINILDQQTRLITPVIDDGQSPSYQLTHDYLVPALRNWLTQKQRETRHGRAGLRLEELSSIWTKQREYRYLPSLREYVGIYVLTGSKNWTAAQRAMMKQATRWHGTQVAMTILVVALLSWFAVEWRGRVEQRRVVTQVQGMAAALATADPGQLSGVIRELWKEPSLAKQSLTPLLTKPVDSVQGQRTLLHARMAAVSHDSAQIEPLLQELLSGRVHYAIAIREQLRPWAGQLIPRLRDVLQDETVPINHRFRAALALVDYVPAQEYESWKSEDLQLIAQQLVKLNTEFLPQVRAALWPVRRQLLPELERLFSAADVNESERLRAAQAIADYASEDKVILCRLLTKATPQQFQLLYPLVAGQATPAALAELSRIAATLPPEDLKPFDRINFGETRANAAVILLRLQAYESGMKAFDWKDDPESLTKFASHIRPRGVTAELLLDWLEWFPETPTDRRSINTCYALLLALGEFELAEIPSSRQEATIARIAEWYAHHPSSTIHGVAGWLLRNWGQTKRATEIDQTPVPYSPDREWFTLAVTVTSHWSPVKVDPEAIRLPAQTFYYTFVVFPPGDYQIGTTDDELVRETDEGFMTARLTRPFAMLDREITTAELIALSNDFVEPNRTVNRELGDVGGAVNWYGSVGFCRWLGMHMGIPELDQAYVAPESLDADSYPRETHPLLTWAPRDWPLNLDKRGFRLPTEAEWEIAGRAGTRTAYSFGGDNRQLSRFGWFQENSGQRMHAPRQLRPNFRGLFDMHGNAWEWVHDWHHNHDVPLVVDPHKWTARFLRNRHGGTYDHAADVCRSGNRDLEGPLGSGVSQGLRLALTLPKNTAAKPDP